MSKGYRVVSFSLKSLEAKTLEFRNPVDLKIGSIHSSPGGLYLGSDEAFCDYYVGGTDDVDLILTFEYDDKDLIQGNTESSSEIRVEKARLSSIKFHDQDLQQKFGQMFNHEDVKQRRSIHRGSCLAHNEAPKKYAVLRAMSEDVGHIFPMDYCYLTSSWAMQTAAKKVVKAYENGTQLTSPLDRAIMKTLEHAVTTACYECAPQHVTCAVVQNNVLYSASNSGEYFYDGESPIKVTTLIKVDEHGAVSLPDRGVVVSKDSDSYSKT